MKQEILKRFGDSHQIKHHYKFPRNNKKFSWDEEDNHAPRGMNKIRSISESSDREYRPSNTAALKRYLLSRVGQPWNEIYSDICATVDARSSQGRHFLDSLEWLIEKHVVIDSQGTVRNERGHEIGTYWNELYIHPDSGKLEYIAADKTSQKREQKQTVFEMNKTLYYKHDGLWYRVVMESIPKPWVVWESRGYSTRYYYTDAFDNHNCSWRFHSSVHERRYGLGPDGNPRYCVSKQSANSKEIAALKKLYKLENQ